MMAKFKFFYLLFNSGFTQYGIDFPITWSMYLQLKYLLSSILRIVQIC